MEVKERILTTAISEDDGTPSLDLALSVAEEFGLKTKDARAIARQAGEGVAHWRCIAADAGISKAEIGRMASAFEHDDLSQSIA